MPVLSLWQRNTLTGEPERLGTVLLTSAGLHLDEAADCQRAWLARIVDTLNRDPPRDQRALHALLASRYNLLVDPAPPRR